MRVRVIRPVEAQEVFDFKVPGTHSALTEVGVVVHNCDTKCYGKTCGVCDVKDLQIRRSYIQSAQTEEDIDLGKVKLIDQRSQAMKVRARLVKDASRRFVMNDHWRFHLRRAAYKAADDMGNPFEITKRSIRFASDETKYKDWTCGVDYVEFGLTHVVGKARIQEWIDRVNGYCDGIQIGAWLPHPANSDSMKTDVDLSLWELEVDADPSVMIGHVERWHASDYVKMILKSDAAYFAPEREEYDAKEFCSDIWLARSGSRLMLRMLLKGRPSPYNVYAALTGKASWIEAAKNPAFKIDAFVEADRGQYDFFRRVCEGCDLVIPSNVFDEPYDPTYCPHCKDRADGTEVRTVSFV